MLNLVVCMGRMAVTPVIEQTPTGIHFCKFRLATERDYADKDGNRRTDFLSFIAWKETADFAAKYFDQGAMVAVRGRLEEETWTDKDGNYRSRMIVNVDGLYFGETKEARELRERRRCAGQAQESYAYTDDDIPPEFHGEYTNPEGSDSV